MKSTKNIGSIDSTSDLARRLQLSRWTISRVLNGHAGVSPATVRRVKEAMRELGFAPNPLASGLRKGKTNIIGVCIPEIERLHLAQKLEFLRQSLTAEGCHVMMGVTNGDVNEEAETLNRFRTLHAAGVILFASRLSSRSGPVRAVHESGIPLISVDPVVPLAKGSISVDRSIGTREAVEHLFELGHRRVIALGLEHAGFYTSSRLAGIASAYQARGWNAERNICKLPLPAQIDSAFAQGFEVAGAVWEKAREEGGYTAVMALNDRVAIGLVDGLRALGVRVPEDLSLVGYDNMDVCSYMLPRLTSIDAQPDELVRQATECLLSQIRNAQEAQTPPPIATRLIVRESTGPARPGIALIE
ncbi:MAG: LacI family DNA-binding transcriptional regulator [Chthoniobacteraceae bacterium]